MFPNFAATQKTERVYTLSQLVDEILAADAPSKDGLRWLKLARFGDTRTDKKSLRHNKNMLAVYGVEADYDAERMSFTDAIKKATDAGILCVVYTSPSHTEDTPRWRVICPFKEEHPPEKRALFLARLNGVFGGIFSNESWTLSQSYYFGSVNRNPSHRAELIDGTPIDQLDHLDAGAIAKPEKPPPKPRPNNAPPRTDQSGCRYQGFIDKLLVNVRAAPDGSKHHTLRDNARSLGGIMEGAGISEADAVAWLLNALPDTVEDRKRAEQTARDGLKHGRGEPIVLEDRPYNGNGATKPHATASEDRPEVDAEAEIARLAKLSTLQYARQRAAAAKTLKIQLALLDKLVARAANTDTDQIAGSPDVAKLIADFNGNYAVVNEGGKAMVFNRSYDPVLRRHHFIRIAFDDFRRLYLNVTVQVATDADGKAVKKPAADVWLRHPDRKQFIGGVVFDPSQKNVPSGALNLWRGFAVKPKPGSWAKMQNHLLTIICGGNTEYRDYFLDWAARLVQFPAEQGEVAVVMKGVEGCGKGIFARAIRTILGQHGLAISNPKHLVGAFNAHLRDSVFLFGDECFFAGDKAHIGVLKSIITEPYLAVEAKFHDVVQAPNFLHVMLASNEDWVIPASIESRRFFMLLVSPARVGDHPYFADIVKEMEHGGYEAMLHDLLTRDISAFNPRKVPVTEGLIEQRKLSLDTPIAWWVDVLHRGYVFTSKLGLEDYFAEWYDEVATDLLFDAYAAFADKRRDRHPMSRETFGRFMVNVARARPRRLKDATVGEHIADDPYGGTSRKAQRIIKSRPTGYSLGLLALARAEFIKKTGLQIDWQDEGEG